MPESALTADAKFTVTDSSPVGEGGTLTVVVADAATVFNNYNISFMGSLSFVKDGAGTFTERKHGHTYTGDDSRQCWQSAAPQGRLPRDLDCRIEADELEHGEVQVRRRPQLQGCGG